MSWIAALLLIGCLRALQSAWPPRWATLPVVAMSGRSKRESRGSNRGKRETESRVSSGRVKRERDRERETDAPITRGSPVRVKREVEPASAREAPVPAVPAVRVKREREADEDSEPEREVRGARGRAGLGLYF